ncbi:hypothetical protein QBC33DRAFT_454824 [Phialemonium atrogriseum]|uniref:ribonuclease Z n=1 Tax=Phialemonium atrogriseum TaxID=1093897 RepID=A0AAJ0FKJ3_9PEZI|nr:uncharacterized protein QBC33DRAFT_454824 [Phialemonium atrogriseum]KAK1765629.1 hypothetical protein QBC33DRAFT_454824 [Phialemonium atrogriseum]
MLNWVEVLSTPTADTGACLAVHFDNRRYLFGNVSEGTQRLLVQRRMSARNIEDIFLTGSINWQNTGGLLGMILTIGDAAAGAKAALKEENEKRAAKGQKEKPASFAALNIHGPRNLTHLLATARKFVFRQGFPLRPHEIRTDPRAHGTCTAKEPDWQDGNLRVWHVPLAHKGRRWRKRSHEALSDSEGDNGKGAQDEPLDAETAHQIRAKAVHDMFDSGWKLDTLKEVPLNTVKLPATLFMRDASGHIVKYDGPLPNGRDLVPDIKVLVRSPWPSALIDSLPPTTQYAESMCYIVKNQARRGKFKVDEARRLGVAQTNFKRLTAGESVPGKDNLTVTPEMVLEPTIEGHGFIIVEVPYISYIESFLSRPEWAAEDVMRGIEAMYWIIKSPEVLQDSRIMSFMQERSSMKHIILSRDTCPNHLPLVSPASEAIKLNRIDPDRFPIPTYSNKPNPPESFGVPDPPYQAAQAGAGLQLAPQVIFQDDKAAPYLDTAQVLKEIHGQSEVIALANAAKAKVSDPAFLAAIEEADKDIPNRDMEVVALGTGSALPSKNRNVSATLIRVPGHGSYLLDCGENTLGQLRRVYGFEGADEIVRDLRAIFISHLHADHHLGAVSVIRRHRDLRYGSSPSPDGDAPRPLGIIAHAHFHDFLTEYKDVEAYLGANVERLVMNEQPRSRTGRSTRVADGARTLRYGLSRVETCFVDHCHGAMAVALTLHPSGLKVAYSGDCRPSAEFAAVGRGAHLLVHESTFDDELAGDALAKKHCTMSEALGVARLMGARRVLLTHFSQRYPKIPVIGPDAGPAEVAAESPPSSEEGGAGKKEGDAGAAAGDMSVLFAFDYMRVKLGDFRKAEAFLPAVQKLYEGLEKD